MLTTDWLMALDHIWPQGHPPCLKKYTLMGAECTWEVNIHLICINLS